MLQVCSYAPFVVARRCIPSLSRLADGTIVVGNNRSVQVDDKEVSAGDVYNATRWVLFTYNLVILPTWLIELIEVLKVSHANNVFVATYKRSVWSLQKKPQPFIIVLMLHFVTGFNVITFELLCFPSRKANMRLEARQLAMKIFEDYTQSWHYIVM